MVYNRESVAPLGDGSDRTQPDEGTCVVMRTQVPVYNYHGLSGFEV